MDTIKTNQPKHTQGECTINLMGNIDCGDMRIANMPSITGREEEIKANANHIVKCWNMHDKLVAGIRLAIEHFAEESMTTFNDKRVGIRKLYELLEQAEQK